MKDQVLQIVQSALSGAEDNLYRANREFGKMTTNELDQKYGQSESTCGEILTQYQIRRDELKRCVAWVNSAT